MALTDITTSEVARAITEANRLGRETFLRDHGFHRSRKYLLAHSGTFYDSKAIVGVAHGFLPGQEPLAAKSFSGGESHAVGLLRNLGFAVVSDPPEDLMTEQDLLERISNLRVRHSPAGHRALYQPITLLWAVGRARRGEERLLPWSRAEEALRNLLAQHGGRGERPRPDYPIAALYRSGLWELTDHSSEVPTAHGDHRPKRWFAENQPLGGLTQPAYELLRRSGEVRLAVIDALLSTFFEGLDYIPLLTETGLYDDGVADDLDSGDAAPVHPVILAAQYDRMCRSVENREHEQHEKRVIRTSNNPIRSASARRAVLLRSQGRCENPACTGQPSDLTDRGEPIIEVDHVMDLASGGRDHPEQMAALCPNCHAIKTRGRSRETLRTTLREVARERHAHWTRSMTK